MISTLQSKVDLVLQIRTKRHSTQTETILFLKIGLGKENHQAMLGTIMTLSHFSSKNSGPLFMARDLGLS